VVRFNPSTKLTRVRPSELIVARLKELSTCREMCVLLRTSRWSKLRRRTHLERGTRWYASSRTTQGNPWLRALLGEVAWAAIRQKNTSFGARFRRLARRQNKQKAMVAVMHHLLIVIYQVLRKREPYQELGPEYFQPTDPQRLVHRHIRQLEQLGYQVTLVPKGAA